MKKYAVIVAGGSGTRLGGDLPKQFRMLLGRPLLWWALKAFRDEDMETELHLVLPAGQFSLWQQLEESLPEKERFHPHLHAGGNSRTESVMSALENIPAKEDVLVAVHDGARPLLSEGMIKRGWEAAMKNKGAVPVVPVTDSLRMLSEEGSEAVDRSRFVAVQTPQVFRGDILVKAYKNLPAGVFTDDASVVEAYGLRPAIFQGEPANMKVTNPGDIEIAELLLTRWESSL